MHVVNFRLESSSKERYDLYLEKVIFVDGSVV